MCCALLLPYSTSAMPQDLDACVKAVKEDPKGVKDGMAPLYGMAAVMPDRSIVGQFLVAYQDAMLTT